MPLECGVDGVVEWLKSKHVIVPKDWVAACLHWLSSENQATLSKEKIYQMVFEQWLYTNLRELEVQSLPNSVKDNVSSLTGCYCLQVESIVDISRPKNQTKEDNKFASNTSTQTQNKWEKKAARLLMFTLCDGTNTVNAIELKPISCLSENVPLGSKVCVKGPVKCRRDVIMLEPHNIDFLGGEVEELAQAGIENRPPNNEEMSESNHRVTSQLGNDHGSETIGSVRSGTVIESNTKLNLASIPLQQAGSSSRHNHIAKQPESAIISLISDDEDEEIIACLEESEQANSQTGQDIENVEDELPINVEMHRSGNNVSNAISPAHINNETSIHSTQYLCHCKKYLREKVSVIRVKAVVTTLLSKLKYDSTTGWFLRAYICDGTAMFDVEFSHDVLLSLIGHSGDGDLLSSQNVELTRNLKNCQNTIMSVCHYMEVSLRMEQSRVVGTVSKIEGLS